MTDSIDIRPSLGDMLDRYESISYCPDTAIAEFVDNSTASYYENQANFKEYNETLFVDIIYDAQKGILEIADNAWGMDKQTFADALTIAKRPQKQGGRNEYGMGMKTAASWFGKKWTVITKTRDSEVEYAAMVDIRSLQQSRQNEIAITSKYVGGVSHYTKIIISDFCRKRKIQDRTIKKLVSALSSIYRADIRTGDITIRLNGAKLVYEIPEILTETIDGIKKVWKYDFEDYLDFDGTRYDFKGFVALRKIGNTKESGFALIRRGRVIVGGSEENFRPAEIFGGSNSFQWQRIFGEINMNNWPVTQTKDAFDWELDGLKEAFIDKLKDIVADYIKKARDYRVKDKEKELVMTTVGVKEIGDQTYDDLSLIEEVEVNPENDIQVQVETNNDQVQIPSYTTTVSILNRTYNIKVDFITDLSKELITVEEDGDLLHITFNAAHPYFSDIKDKEAFVKVFQKYLILQVIAEKYLTYISTNGGMVYPYEVRETINRMLEEIKKGSGDNILN